MSYEKFKIYRKNVFFYPVQRKFKLNISKLVLKMFVLMREIDLYMFQLNTAYVVKVIAVQMNPSISRWPKNFRAP